MIAIPNMKKPKGCLDCPVNDMACELWTEVVNIKTHIHKDCPLIEIDETDTELLEFFNEFKKWENCKEVAKYIRAVYGGKEKQ